MNKEQKRKLRNISLLALVGLIGGTFAFQAFNQQAINDRLRDNEVEVGGRVHDYYNRDTENKDVFVENYGQEEIMARIRLSEFMEIQQRGATEFEPVVYGTSRENVSSWTTWIPSATSLDDRQGDSDAFDAYSDLTFGWERNGQFAPWYLPTFNLIETDERTAAAGHARDYYETDGAADGVTDGATHPGDGTDDFWDEDDSYDNSAGDWFGSQVIRETAQNLQQQHPVVTLQEWAALPNAQKIGDFWVVDHETGWAYWASELKTGETTSYLVDAAEMKQAADDINGSYYYGIHVESNLISPDENFEDEPDTGYDGMLGELLLGIRNNGVDDDWGNPPADEDVQPDELIFSIMNPGRNFTMAGERYRYLDDMGEGNHMIIRSSAFQDITFSDQESKLQSWYEGLDNDVKNIVQPVRIAEPVPAVDTVSITWLNFTGWIPNNLGDFPQVAADVTKVDSAMGSERAFALSLADVTRLSGPGLGFPNLAGRAGEGESWWWLRTPGAEQQAWRIHSGGRLETANVDFMGVRPALIINQ